MATVYKISDEFYDDSFVLIALHCSLEDYALAYAMNKVFKANFKRTKLDLDILSGVSFPMFEWQNELADQYFTLITNNSVQEEDQESEGLFQYEVSYTTHHLISEHKEVDYFLKIEQDNAVSEPKIVQSILTIPKVITAYEIDIENLKSKNNLIF